MVRTAEHVVGAQARNAGLSGGSSVRDSIKIEFVKPKTFVTTFKQGYISIIDKEACEDYSGAQGLRAKGDHWWRKVWIKPNTSARWWWDGIILITIASVWIFIPLEDTGWSLSEKMGLDQYHWSISIVCSLMLTIVFGIDGLNHWNTDTSPTTRSLTFHEKPRKRWLRVADFMAAVPLDILFLWHMPTARVLAHLRLIKICRVPGLWSRVTANTGFEMTLVYQILPIVNVFFWLMIVVHIFTCTWMAIREESAERYGLHEDDYSYTTALYFVLATVTSVGYGEITPKSAWQQRFCSVLFLLGTFINGLVVGILAAHFHQLDSKAQLTEEMRKTIQVMKGFAIPKRLQQEVLNFQHHNLKSINHMSVISNLPDALCREVIMYVRMRFIARVPFMESAPVEARVALATSLHIMVVEPDAYIIRAGENNDSMYWLSHGVAKVVDDKNNTLATIGKEGFFGEMSMFQTCKYTYSVSGKTYCELLRCDRDAFERALEPYPDFYNSLLGTFGACEDDRGNNESMAASSSMDAPATQKVVAGGKNRIAPLTHGLSSMRLWNKASYDKQREEAVLEQVQQALGCGRFASAHTFSQEDDMFPIKLPTMHEHVPPRQRKESTCFVEYLNGGQDLSPLDQNLFTPMLEDDSEDFLSPEATPLASSKLTRVPSQSIRMVNHQRSREGMQSTDQQILQAIKSMSNRLATIEQHLGIATPSNRGSAFVS